MELFLKIKSTWLFRKLSSVQTAVPLLLFIAAIVSWGTIVESRYNSEYARLLVYDAWWFQGLLVLLATNILFAALSRIPYKIQHMGFVITHIGLLTLLLGSAITKIWGIDGQMTVAESSNGRTVMLSERVFEIASNTTFKKIYIPRLTKSLDEEDLSKINEQMPYGYKILKYIPFVRPTANINSSEGVTIQFKLQSAFFNQDVVLNSVSQPELQMGPATLRLTKDSSKKAAKTAEKDKTKARDTVAVLDVKNGSALKHLSLDSLKKAPVELNGVSIKLVKLYTHATIRNNKISDGGEKSNPAVELSVTKGQKTLREVLYAKFPTFSLNEGGLFGLRLTYTASSEPEVEGEGGSDGSAPAARLGNVIEFRYLEPADGGEIEQIKVDLYKNEKLVLSQKIKKMDAIQTPWMGMKITLEGISMSSDMPISSQVSEIEVPMKTDQLPPSAIYLGLRSNQEGEKGIWLVEGSAQKINLAGESAEVYYGRDYLNLPFIIHLEKFYKKDYPGTDTAISFESHVKINEREGPVVISMNEPLYRAGYTLYQSSYDIQPGRPTLSIFSVNKDPGRWVKYLGSIILGVGIITFTYMRSRFYKLKRGLK